MKVQKKAILVRFFGMNVEDPKHLVTEIPKSHGWQHDKEIRVESLEFVDYAMRFIEASYRSSLTNSPPVPFGKG